MQTETRFVARYAETDQMGIIHHSNYAVWFEAGRTDFLKKAGVSNTDIEARGILLPLYEMSCQFKNPARYEDEIMVITSLKQISRVRLCFSYQVLNAANHKLLATGETMHAWTDKALKPVNAEKTVPGFYSILNRAVNENKTERRKVIMKIAVASEGKLVTEHFGHCEGFTVFEAENNQIKGKEFIPNPGHRPGFLPVFLYEKGVNVIISGGMGGGAVDIFNEKGIEIITGASGEAETAASNYLQGKLKSTGSVCHEHQHASECGE